MPIPLFDPAVNALRASVTFPETGEQQKIVTGQMDGRVGIVQHFSSQWQILGKKFSITFFLDLYPLSGQYYCSAVSLPCSPGECKNMSKLKSPRWFRGSDIFVDRILVMAYVYFNTSWVEMRGMHNIIYMSRVIHFNCYLQCVTYSQNLGSLL